MASLRFPGFIDVHVHLREPGAKHKEDFLTGTRAAVKGGFTLVLDMPNNPIPTVTVKRLEQKMSLANKKAICDVGFHFGTNGKNVSEFPQVWKRKEVYGLKLYLNQTTGEMLIEDLRLIEDIFAGWRSEKPILVHAEGRQLAAALGLAQLFGRRLHVAHISKAQEVELVRRAKKKRLAVTAGVTPHHLFLTEEDRKKLGALALMKPPLGSKKDRDWLWQGVEDGTIDLVETDHAPHTLEEKSSKQPAFGVPGLETAVGLCFWAVYQGKMSFDLVKKLLFVNPKKIFNIPDQPRTWVEIDPDASFIVGEGGWETKCGWSPFAGWRLYGRVKKVVLRGNTLLEQGKIVC